MRALFIAAVLSGCAPVADPFKQASALIEPRAGSSAYGAAEFSTIEGGGVKVTVRVAGATQGDHGLHLHQNPDCSSADAKSAGDHWNPEGVEHGVPGEGHPGDLGNVSV